DVTYEELLKQQLIQTQKMEAIGTLAGGIAHDFNNILASIMGFTEMAQIKSRTGRPVQRDLEMVLKASVRARDLVKQILTFCRKHEQHKQIVHLRPLIKECAKMLRATIPTTIDICLELGREGDVVFADPVQMHQVMTNLCSNAAQAMPNGGVLTIILKVQDRDPESMCPSDVEPGTYVHLEVRDTGCGMREDVVDRIFDPFFTTKGSGEGTGMGLPVVHGIVKGHGGSIAVRSTPGEGSSFTVLIPMAEGKEQKHPAQNHSLPRGTGKILFVDDEDTIILLAKSFLGDLGYDVHSTRDSREALEIFKQDPESFDLVITDQTMPHLTGMVLAQNLKAIRPEIPVILCTGYSSTITSTTLEESGVDELLIKPLELHRMAAAIHGFLSR
ncbi:MAG: ATP-binding protein, partial [bacterium]